MTRGTTQQTLTLALVDLALGYHRPSKEVEALAAQGVDYDAFLEFDHVDLAATWRQHRAALLAEWRRRGHTGVPRSCPRI